MKYLLDQKEAKAVDTHAIQQLGIPSLVLMERAALAVAEEAARHVEKDQLILAVCGTGNNGADGIAAARILHGMGYRTALAIVGEKAHATEEWQLQLEIAKKLHIPVWNQYAAEEYCNRERPGLLLDALFGIGLSREVEGTYREAVEFVNRTQCPVLAVDIASGIHAGTGRVLGCAVSADWTVTFGCEKLGQVLYPGADYSGQVVIADIGFPKESLEAAASLAFAWEKADLARLPKRPAHSHKGTFGKVLVIAGQKNMAGAAVFAATAAYRMGAGLVQVMTAEENRVILQEKLPEAVLCTYDPEAFTIECMKEPCSWADVIVIGPGMGKGSHVRSMLNYLFQYTEVPVVVDADGLNVLAGNPAMLELLAGRAIVTPHMGEMSRLCGLSVPEVQKDPVGVARAFANHYQAVCVLKDSRTVTAAFDGSSCVNLAGNSGMATGGSGDVLSGVIAGLLAAGMPPFQAAALGVYIHSLAGDAAAESRGEHSLMAGDILNALSQVLRGAEKGE